MDGERDDDRADAAAPDPLERRIADARPDADALTRAVVRSRVASALFGEAAPVTVGRYRLGRQLGRGGGGSVFTATDPELHRDVAVKLIRCTSARHRELAVAEARALAKLSHPNVVPVHDVGETADHVYLVMELLRGQSLRELAGPAGTVRALVAAYRQAASGLAAAHAAGLIHRDFKPDNAMFGDDGRLRVVDFGLATDAAGGDAAAVGTPRYMAPEQRAGTPADPAVDQYALGASLREAVTTHGRRAPAWLARVLARATASRPADRYPSLAALAAALGDDPRSRWRRRAVIVIPLAVALAGFGLGREATRGGPEPCAGGDEALAPVWTPGRVAEVVRAVEQLGTPFAAAIVPVIRDRLDRLGRDWLAARRQSCTAHARRELSDVLYDRSIVCFARSRIGLGAAVELLATASTEQLAQAVSALALVDPAGRCADPAVLAAEANPQATPVMRVIDQQIELAAIHTRAGTSRAVPLARTAEALARDTGDARLRARALLVLGHAYMGGSSDLAGAPLHEAMMLGVAAGDDSVTTEAYARHAFVRAFTGDTAPRVPEGLELARAIGERAGDAGRFARALLSNNIGAIAMLAGDVARARAEFQRAVTQTRAVAGPGEVELQTAVSNLALLTPDAAERQRLHDTAIAEATAAVGPDHPQSLDQQLLKAVDTEDPRAVVAALAVLCRRIATLHPTLDWRIERCALELAWQATAIGEAAAAADIATLVPRPGGAPSGQGALVLAYATVASGRPPAPLIAELAQRARDAAAAVAQHGWIQNWAAADAQLALAAATRAVGEAARSRQAAARALAYLEAYRGFTGVADGSLTRRLAWARALQGAGGGLPERR